MNTATRRLPYLAAAATLALWAVAPSAVAQSHTCTGFAISDDTGLRIVDLAAQTVATHATQSFPWTQLSPVGPRLVLTDTAGTAILDRAGVQLGFIATLPGSFQSVTLGTDRFIVVENDRVRIVDLDGRTVGQPIPKTGTTRQTIYVGGGRLVVVDSDQLRVFDRDGNAIGAPLANTGRFRQTVVLDGDRIIVTDDTSVRFFDRDMNPVGAPIANTGNSTQRVVVDGDRILVIDDNGTQIYDRNGLRKTTIAKTGTRRQDVKVSGNRVVLIDDNQVRVFDRDGLPVGAPVATNGRADVHVTNDRIVITDDQQTWIFDKNGLLITTVAKTGTDRQNVTVDGDRIIIVDQDQTRIFGSDGVRRGAPILRTGIDTQVIRVRGDRILVIDGNEVRVFDREGRQVGSSIQTQNVQEFNVLLFDAVFTITDDRYVHLFDRDANRLGQPVSVTSSVQHVQVHGGRIVIAEDTRIRLFDLNGQLVGTTPRPQGSPEVQAICFEAGTATTFGTGCAGSAGVVQQSVFGEPRIGGELTFFLANAPANTAAVLNLGFSDQSWGGLPLPFDLAVIGAPGCLLLTDMAESFAALTGAAGFAEVVVRVPAEPGLVGLEAFTQFVVPDPGANALGLTTSNGAAVGLGEGI